MRRILRGFLALFVLALVSNFAQAQFDLIRQEWNASKTRTAVSLNLGGEEGRAAGLAAVRGISDTGNMSGPALADVWPPRGLGSLGSAVFMKPAVAHAARTLPAVRTAQHRPKAAFAASGRQAPGKSGIAAGRLKQSLAMKTAPKNLASSAWR